MIVMGWRQQSPDLEQSGSEGSKARDPAYKHCLACTSTSATPRASFELPSILWKVVFD